MSPRRWIPSCVCLCTPPMSWSRMPFLTISCPADQPPSSNSTATPPQRTIDSRSDARNEPLVDVVRVYHGSQLVDLLFRQRVEESVLVLDRFLRIPADVNRSSLPNLSATRLVTNLIQPHLDVGRPDVARQESSLVLQISHSQSLQTSETLAGNSAIASSWPIFSLHFLVHTRQAKLRDVGNDNESSGEGTLVSRFRLFHHVRTQNDIKPGNHQLMPLRNG